jgi:hypothetical protein
MILLLHALDVDVELATSTKPWYSSSSWAS